MPTLRRCLTIAALTGAAVSAPGCRDRGPPPGPAAADDAAPPAAVDPGRKAALAAVWRASVQYRSAHLAYAGNAPGMAQDVAKARRMLETVQALERAPVVADPAADAAAVEAMLRAHLEALKIRGATIEVKTRPAPEMPPRRISSQVGLEYTPEQIAGTHDVTLTLPRGLESGPRFFRSRSRMPRLFVVTAARIDGAGRATLQGEVPFFRDLQPVELYRERPDPDRLIAEAAGAPPEDLEGPLKETAEKIRANYARVDAAQADLEKAYRREARLKIDTGRFAAYSALVDRFNGATWASLMRGVPVKAKKAKGGGHAH